jgi:archaellum component FlaG (FlaF/FlaG flagellin family)
MDKDFINSKTIHNERRINMKSIMKASASIVLLLFAVFALWAGDVTGGVTTTITTLDPPFEEGQVASAGAVNQRFALIRDAVNDNDARIDTLESTAAIKNGTLQTNLNADLLDGQQGSYYLSASNVNAGTLNTARFSAYSDLSSEGYLGNASGDVALNNGTKQTNLNADLLDGHDTTYFATSNHNHYGTAAQVNFKFAVYATTTGSYKGSGYVTSSGSLGKGYNIKGVSYNSALGRYEILIANVSYYYQDYYVVVDPVNPVHSWYTSSVSGMLLVYFRN